MQIQRNILSPITIYILDYPATRMITISIFECNTKRCLVIKLWYDMAESNMKVNERRFPYLRIFSLTLYISGSSLSMD